MSTNIPDRSVYETDTGGLLTPALAIYPEMVRHNIRQTVALLDGQPSRWRPHLKTVKLASMMRLLVSEGVTTAKCATTLELLVACESGLEDVLVAFGHTGANASRIGQIAAAFPQVRTSVLIESRQQLSDWVGRNVNIFIDVNPGMDRTGVGQECIDDIVGLARAVDAAGLVFCGIHFYDGHATENGLAERTEKAHQRYNRLLRIVSRLGEEGLAVPEVITAGTPALPCALSFAQFKSAGFTHQVSPGTIIYNDATSLTQLPAEYDLRPAVAVITRVISHPKRNLITCDAGHKSVSVDSGVPNCVIAGEPGLQPMKPSEEHLPIAVGEGAQTPPRGSVLYLIPKHVCPTVNNFDHAALITGGSVIGVEGVSARGREAPVLRP